MQDVRHAECNGSHCAPLPGDDDASQSPELRAICQRLAVLEASHSQLRFVASQLARENQYHHQQAMTLVRTLSWRYKLRQTTGSWWRHVRKKFVRPRPQSSAAPATAAVVTAGPISAAERSANDAKYTVCPTACFFGDGISGSWMMRSQQVALMHKVWMSKSHMNYGWRLATPGYQVFCFVKRFDPQFAQRLRAKGVRVVYDLVDPWRQPEDGLANKSLSEVIRFFRNRLENLPVDGVIFPTQSMCDDLGKFVPNPITIYHHHRIGLPPIDLRRQARVVAYEGEPSYLGPWLKSMQHICGKLNLQFVINPPSLSDADIGFAARGGDHGSLMARRYKSNVKLANFLAAGLPCVVHRDEVSYQETGNEHVRRFADENELEQQIRSLLPYEARVPVHVAFLEQSRQYRVETIAEQYEAYFRRLVGQPQAAIRENAPAKAA